jgi:hypothetical protein
VHVSAIPVVDGEQPIGFVVLLHDVSFIERREAKTRYYLLLALGLPALAASAVTVIAARRAWRSWSDELRGFLRSGSPGPDFQSILHDVRELVDRIVAEKEVDKEGGPVSPQTWNPHAPTSAAGTLSHRRMAAACRYRRCDATERVASGSPSQRIRRGSPGSVRPEVSRSEPRAAAA